MRHSEIPASERRLVKQTLANSAKNERCRLFLGLMHPGLQETALPGVIGNRHGNMGDADD